MNLKTGRSIKKKCLFCVKNYTTVKVKLTFSFIDRMNCFLFFILSLICFKSIKDSIVTDALVKSRSK